MARHLFAILDDLTANLVELKAVPAEGAHESKLKKMPFGLGRLLPAPTIEITDERWRRLRARISGSFPVVKP